MKTPKHTPGPWTARVLERQGFHEYPLGYKTIFNLDASFNHEDQGRGIRGAGTLIVFGPEGEKNADLIASAPELLAALELALPEIEQLIKDSGPCEHDVNICVCGLIRLAEQTRAAIAKAKGGA